MTNTQLPRCQNPCAPPKSMRRRMAIFVTTFPSLRSGNDNLPLSQNQNRTSRQFSSQFFLVNCSLVQGLHGGGGHAAQQLVHHAGLVKLVGVEEALDELHGGLLLGVLVVHPLERRLEEAVPEAEGPRGELVEDGGVALLVVAVVVPNSWVTYLVSLISNIYNRVS